MKTGIRQTIIAVALGVSLASGNCSGQEPQKSPDPTSAATLREQARPGPEHAQLAKYAGNWKTTVTMGDGSVARKSNGRVRSYMMMDGRYLWIAYNVAGAAGSSKGAFMIGFDRRNRRYSLIGIDTFGTYHITSQGSKDPDTGTIKLYGKDDDPHMKAMGFDKEFAHTIDFRSPDEFTIDVHFIDTRTPERREVKSMGFVFTRTKKE